MKFEETYPRYAFSELVRLGLAAAKFVIRFHKWRQSADERRQSAGLRPTKPAH